MADKKSTSTLSYFTPARAIRRAFSAVSNTGGVLRQTASSLGEMLPGQSGEPCYEEGDVRNIKDARLRYQAMYELHGWTEKDISKQLKTYRLTKMTAFISAVAALCGVIVLAIKAPLVIAVVLIPVSGSALVLGIAQGFKYALYEAQISLREFISAREFVSREDFWLRLLG